MQLPVWSFYGAQRLIKFRKDFFDPLPLLAVVPLSESAFCVVEFDLEVGSVRVQKKIAHVLRPIEMIDFSLQKLAPQPVPLRNFDAVSDNSAYAGNRPNRYYNQNA
jgi:hypothetical protein